MYIVEERTIQFKSILRSLLINNRRGCDVDCNSNEFQPKCLKIRKSFHMWNSSLFLPIIDPRTYRKVG